MNNALKRLRPLPLLLSCLGCSVLKKADARSDTLSADLAQKNKLVDKVAELQRKTGEVRFEMQPEYSVCHNRQGVVFCDIEASSMCTHVCHDLWFHYRRVSGCESWRGKYV